MTNVIKFQEERDGIPMEVDVKQPDGKLQTVSLFFATDENALTGLFNKVNKVQADIKDIQAKYPALNEELSDQDMEQFQQAITGASELVKVNYDEIFGEGTYQRLSDAGLGFLKLIPLLDKMTGAIAERLEEMGTEQKQNSQKTKAELLIKKKKQTK